MHSKTFTMSKEPNPTTSKVTRAHTKGTTSSSNYNQPGWLVIWLRWKPNSVNLYDVQVKWWDSVGRKTKNISNMITSRTMFRSHPSLLSVTPYSGGKILHHLWKSYAPLLLFLLTTRLSCKQVKKPEACKSPGFRFLPNLFGKHLN